MKPLPENVTIIAAGDIWSAGIYSPARWPGATPAQARVLGELVRDVFQETCAAALHAGVLWDVPGARVVVRSNGVRAARTADTVVEAGDLALWQFTAVETVTARWQRGEYDMLLAQPVAEPA